MLALALSSTLLSSLAVSSSLLQSLPSIVVVSIAVVVSIGVVVVAAKQMAAPKCADLGRKNQSFALTADQ